MHSPLLPIHVEHEMDATFGGADLKRIAKADDGHTYAVKRLLDHPTLPLCEWVGYHLCRAVGVRTPDFAVLQYRDGKDPAFGSRFVADPREIKKDPSTYEAARFFSAHHASIAKTYPLDAFLVNLDRHGGNFLLSRLTGGESLLAIDFSRAWVRFGEPFGDTEALRDSQTSRWWSFFKRHLNVTADLGVLQRIATLPDDWLRRVVESAPGSWASCVDLQGTYDYWETHRASDRIEFVKRWL